MPGVFASDREVLVLCGFAFVIGLALITFGMVLDPPRLLRG